MVLFTLEMLEIHGDTMNIDEYKKRIEEAHTFTGVPTYWQELQEVTEERDRLKKIVEELRAENQRLSQIAGY
jgi:GTP1/Obg family GTP-binding protein